MQIDKFEIKYLYVFGVWACRQGYKMKDLDKIDRALVSILRANARTSVVELAKKLQVSRATIQNRMTKLEKSGTIMGYTVSLRPDVDEAPVRAFTCINTEGKQEERVISLLRGNPHITALHGTNGKWDLIAEIRTDTLESFNTVINEIRLIKGIISTETNLLLDSYKF